MKCISGIDCEHDFDGCAAKPCSLGRNCTDIKAADHEAGGPAYVCEPCPLGYTDDGQMCAGMSDILFIADK